MKEKFLIWLAWKLPRNLAYWAAVRVNSEATTIHYTDRTPSEVSIIEALKVWH